MKLFKFKAELIDDELNNMDVYVRAESEDDVVGFAVAYYEFEHEKNPNATPDEIADYVFEPDWEFEFIKDYPPSSRKKAGAVGWDTAHRIIHKAL